MDIMDINDKNLVLALVADTANRVNIDSKANYVSIYNPGDYVVYVRSGNDSVTATAEDTPIPPRQKESFRIDGRDEYVAGYCEEADVTLNIQVGKGV